MIRLSQNWTLGFIMGFVNVLLFLHAFYFLLYSVDKKIFCTLLPSVYLTYLKIKLINWLAKT